MKLAVVGAGATGGFLGARLAAAGVDVTLIARGAHLQAMREQGVEVRGPDGVLVAHPHCTDEMAAIAEADTVFLTLKAYSLPALAPEIGRHLTASSTVVSAQNGIPWWYFQREGGQLEGRRLESVDPGGVIAASIPAGQVVGCVVYPATTLVAPGLIDHIEGNRFSIGEPDSSRSERCQAIAAVLTGAGLKCPVQPRLRQEIWLKLLGNASLNPVSALTRATLQQIMELPPSLALIRALMEEVAQVAAALGVKMDLGVERRLQGAVSVGHHKTSMLQDVEAGRPLEVEALVGSVVELGAILDVRLPRLETIYASTKLLDEALRQARGV